MISNDADNSPTSPSLNDIKIAYNSTDKEYKVYRSASDYPLKRSSTPFMIFVGDLQTTTVTNSSVSAPFDGFRSYGLETTYFDSVTGGFKIPTSVYRLTVVSYCYDVTGWVYPQLWNVTDATAVFGGNLGNTNSVNFHAISLLAYTYSFDGTKEYAIKATADSGASGRLDIRQIMIERVD